MAFTPEQLKAHRARQKAFKALAAFVADRGTVRESCWSLVEDVPVYVPLSDKQRKAAQRDRARALLATSESVPLLHRLKLANALDSVYVPPVEDDQPVPVFDSVICDWLTITHPLREYYPPVNDGQILRVKKDGTYDWTTECWETLKCPSSDTSLRIKCDGHKIMMTGNIGRFGQSDNLNGFTVSECIDKWRAVLADYFRACVIPKTNATTGLVTLERFPAIDLSHFFGADLEMLNRATGEIEMMGSRITRCDLAGNFYTDNFAALTAMLMTRKLGQRAPRAGKFGPMWGYDSKRSNWLKAKVYDKTCELEGRRTPAAGATTARFEVQLGSEILKRRELHTLAKWKGLEMENVIFHEFSKDIFKEQATAENWSNIPSRIRHYAICWRDGVPLRATRCTCYSQQGTRLDAVNEDRCNQLVDGGKSFNPYQTPAGRGVGDAGVASAPTLGTPSASLPLKPPAV